MRPPATAATLPPNAVDRATGEARTSERRWRPIAHDPAELVAVHRDLRGGGDAALLRVVRSPAHRAEVGSRADELYVAGLRRMLRDVRSSYREEGSDG